MPMSTTWASKISRILSPTSSYMPVDVEVGRQALLDAVDDRQLGGALVRLGQQPLRLAEEAGILECDAHARRDGAQHPLVAIGIGGGSLVAEDDDPDRLAAGHDRHAQPGFVHDVVRLGFRVFAEEASRGLLRCPISEPQRAPLADHDGGDATTELDWQGVHTTPCVELEREADHVGRSVIQTDVQILDVELGREALPDQLDDAVVLELLGQGGTDLVDDRQLGVALLGLGEQALRLVEQPSVLERHAHAARDRGQQPLVGIGVGVGLAGLEGDDPDDPLAGRDGDARATTPTARRRCRLRCPSFRPAVEMRTGCSLSMTLRGQP